MGVYTKYKALFLAGLAREILSPRFEQMSKSQAACGIASLAPSANRIGLIRIRNLIQIELVQIHADERVLTVGFVDLSATSRGLLHWRRHSRQFGQVRPERLLEQSKTTDMSVTGSCDPPRVMGLYYKDDNNHNDNDYDHHTKRTLDTLAAFVPPPKC